ncbi:MAG: iron chelate uptake ABC transporter family permease subunit, partial [Polyangiales bacterium]
MKRTPLFVAGGAAILLIVAAAFVGEPISLSRAFSDPSSIDHAILFRARLPRIALGGVAGAGLALTGGSYQALLRNPLAEPYVLGVAGGAALGATLAIAAAAALPVLLASVTAAIAAALFGGLATLLVWFLAARGGGAHATAILLAGVIVNAIAAGAITFVKTLVRATTAQQLLVWLAGFVDVPTPA